MAAADQAAIAAGTASLVLMERAGWAVARAVVRVGGGAYGRRVLVVCGKGNNAGDGLVAARLLAVDIPSGVDGVTGHVEGPAIRATVTVTMAAPKLGIVVHPGSELAGTVEVADIGIPTPQPPAVVGMPEAPDVAAVLGRRPLDSHKRSVGTVLIVAGSVGMSGAMALAASGALRTGAGLVTMATVASVAREVDQTVVEATTLPLPETTQGTIATSAVGPVLERASSVDAVAIGPG